ncbi:MAG: TetR/AcrR family transcriptional regulator [Bacteroidia bacterium]|nr:TetR/AcrR family transcriptional regulator [Bacteroidia bacterium]
MPRVKDQSKLEAIHNATLTIVNKNGYAGFKMSEVAHKAKIATGTLYIYFKNKNDLINDLYLRVKKRSVEKIFKDYDPTAPFMIGFEKIWRNYLSYKLFNPEESLFAERYFRSSYLRPGVVQETEKLLYPIFELLERGKNEKLIANIPTELLTAQLLGGLKEISDWHLSRQLNLNIANTKYAFDMAWKSIRR